MAIKRASNKEIPAIKIITDFLISSFFLRKRKNNARNVDIEKSNKNGKIVRLSIVFVNPKIIGENKKHKGQRFLISPTFSCLAIYVNPIK